jgi:hypothetical protein
MLWTRPADKPAPAACAAKGRPPPFTTLLWLAVETRVASMAPSFCDSVWKPLAARGVNIVMLGDASALHTKGWEYYHTKKLQLVHSFLEAHEHELPDAARTLVLHGDMSDSVLFAESLLELVDCVSATYCDRGLDAAEDVLFVGERGLWPPREQLYPRDRYNFSDEDASRDYRFLNSGLYAGSARSVRELLAGAMAAELSIPSFDDQEVLNWMAMNAPSFRPRIHLDQSHRCFGSAYAHSGEIAAVGGRFRQTKLGASPSIVHFNSGAAKRDDMPAMLNGTDAYHRRWEDPALAGGSLVRLGQTWGTSAVASFADLCRPLQSPLPPPPPPAR